MSVPCRHPACKKPLVFLVGKKALVPVEVATLDPDLVKRIEKGEQVRFDPKVHKTHFIDCPGAKGFRGRGGHIPYHGF